MKTRVEKDALGKKEVPSNAYFGIHTQRALENFPISGRTLAIEQFYAIAAIKLAAARVNSSLGLLDKKKAKAIGNAAQEVLKGKFDAQFVVDIYQAGAGTPTHMNVNEVIANRATEFLGGKKGQYYVHPNDHVNMGQSTNDVFPTAMRLTLIPLVKGLQDSLGVLEKSFRKKAREFDNVVKSGRTHLQDAVPIRFGQEIGAWATLMEKERENLSGALDRLHHVGIGGSAVGTGINTHKDYGRRMVKELHRVTGLQIEGMTDLFASMQSVSDFVFLANAVREIAIELNRISWDLQLLGSGPRTGLGELELPAVEAGSSIMPGKVNPNMAEMLCMICYQVLGNGMVVEQAGHAGKLELNAMMPVIVHNLIESVKILTNGIHAFERRCVRGLKVNKKRCKENFEGSLALATFLNPIIGYEQAAEVSKTAYKEGKTVRDVVIEKGILSEKELDTLLDPKKVTKANVK